ncbi:tetratricopeptide repeat-containing sensor histidine kinase [Sphingobacterium hungaricum]|uniref:Signal transduction histidine kinase internal region domain-containing protein n=1 Tax=Sphingobacterium hungaricum TaxID=2082723 RepID=A0A928UV12_9SPHI|nr:histidine kinase [Sphingobacterium hungaricum]MBE8712086.1 hypothetical protein [Sphingobacterium hungaricum]
MIYLRTFLICCFSSIYFLGISQSGYKNLLLAAEDSSANQNYEASLRLAFQAKALKGKDPEYSEKVNSFLGSYYEALGKIDSSIYFYGEAIAALANGTEYADLSFLYNRMGDIEQNYTERYPLAIAYFAKQLKYDKLLQDSASMFDCLNNLGLAYKSNQQLDSALHYFNQVTNTHSPHNAAKSYALLFTADTYSLQKKYPHALRYYDQAIQELNQVQDSIGLYSAYANKGDLLMHQRKFNESIVQLEQAQRHLNPYITSANKAVLYHNFAEVYHELDVFDKAFYYKELETLTKDSINSENIANAVATMTAKYELRQKEDSLFIQQQELVLADAKTKEKERNFLILLIVSIALLILFVSLYRIRQLKYKHASQKQQSEQQAVELLHQYQLSESELKSVRSQMNPHFIFNVLNSIESYIMDNERRTASRLIQKFAALSRLILENSTKSLVTADKEWKSLLLYTELESMRFSNAFSYDFKVGENIRLKDILLPPMLIQPLIENAVLHGLLVQPTNDAHLSVSIEKSEEQLCITVKDNGVGFQTKPSSKATNSIKEKSMGLASIRERIALINKQYPGERASFSITTTGDETIAVICLPLILSVDT